MSSLIRRGLETDWIQRALNLVGLVLMAVGIGMWSVPAGVVAGGIACWVFEWRIDSDFDAKSRGGGAGSQR